MRSEKKIPVSAALALTLWACLVYLYRIPVLASAIQAGGFRGLADQFASAGTWYIDALCLAACAFAALGCPRPDKVEAIVGALAAAACITGRSFDASDSFAALFGTPLLTVCSLLCFAGISTFLARFCAFAFHQARRINSRAMQPGRSVPWRHPLLTSWLIILLGWLPYLVFYYPGSLEWDMIVQINTFNGHYRLTNVHPFFSTWLMGTRMELGRTLGSDAVGAYLYILLQAAMLSLAFAATLSDFSRRGITRRAYIACLAYFCVMPFWGFIAQFGVKDVLYTAVLVLFGLRVWRALLDPDGLNVPNLVMLLALGFLVCLLRSNGFIVVLLSLLALLPFAKASKRLQVAGTVCVLLALNSLWNSAVLPALGVEAGSVSEAMSIPFQQTARYVRDYGGEVTEEEREAIDGVLTYDKLADGYQSFRSDNVKGGVRETATAREYLQYFRTWCRMSIKHPVVYLEATVANSYAYFDPYARLPILPLCQFNVRSEPQKWIDKMNLEIDRSDAFGGARAFLETVYDIFKKLPVVGLLVSIGAYTLLMMAMTAFLIAERRACLIAGLVPAIATILICAASPVNGMLRYYLPVMALAPAAILGIRAGLGNRLSLEENACRTKIGNHCRNER